MRGQGVANETLRRTWLGGFAYQKKPNGSHLPSAAAMVRATTTTAESLWLQCNIVGAPYESTPTRAIPRPGERVKFTLSREQVRRAATQSSYARPKRTQPLWPPRPIAFDSATSTRAF